MKRIAITIFTIGTIAAVGTACKKPKDNSTQNMITGTWKLTIEADDVNGNGVMDASEQMADTTNYLTVYNAGGTGHTIANGVHEDGFTWAVDGATLKLTDTALTTLTINLHIDNISASKMTLSNTFGGSTSWEVFEKQ
ncbi:MAG: hypothetical protein K0Q79_929 [Flavipsychrobacter sp.]|jgi:hypothetical protein|nr:hypothetical protein [Flavipsychrobacter sp.]